jgi:hypothetical protein
MPAGERQDASGFFASGDYQFARRWFMGVRADRSGRPLEADLHDSGGSIHLTFKPTEFSLIRGSYRHTSYAEAPTRMSSCFSSTSRLARTARIRSK